MKKAFVILPILIFAAACAAPPTNKEVAPANTNRSAETAAAPLTEADAIAKEKSVWDAIKRKDYDAFSNMLAPDYIELGSDGVYDKAGIVSYLKDVDISEATFSDWKMMPIDKDAALLVYGVTIKGKYKGQAFPEGPYWAGSAWVNRDGKWLAIYYQETMSQKAQPMPPMKMSTPAASPVAKSSPLVAPDDAVAREKMVWDTIKRKDYDAFASLLDESQIEVWPNGIQNKAKSVEGVRMFDASKAELSDFKTVRFDQDAELVSYTVTTTGAKPDKARAASIWAKRDGKWLALYHHGTPVEAMATPSPTPSASASPAKK